MRNLLFSFSMIRYASQTDFYKEIRLFVENIEWNAQIDALIYRIQRSDKQALSTLYDIAGGKLLGIIIRIVSDRHESEEVLQDVFVKLWQQAKQMSGEGSAWAWLCVITRNSALDRLRKLKRHPHVSTDEDPFLLDTFMGENLTEDSQENTMAVNHCLQQLKEQARKSILLSYVQGYSHSELAEKMSAPLGTVKAWVRRGLQELKICLEA